MAENVKKQGSISPVRVRLQIPKIVVASKFAIRKDRILEGFIEFLFEPMEKGLPTEKITFDISIFKTGVAPFKEYVVGLKADENDDALSKDIPFAAGGLFANMINVTQSGGRAETSFGVVSLSEWVLASRKAGKEKCEVSVDSIDLLSVFSDASFQKKFVLELITAIESGKP